MEQANGARICQCVPNLMISSSELSNCRPRDYLTSEVFPTMIPALNQMLKVAKVTEVSTELSGQLKITFASLNFREERGLIHWIF